jgi:hypothetical protein
MTWLRLDDGFAEHPKVLVLSDKAFRLHVRAMCYCARHLTDGILPPAFCPRSRSMSDLLAAGVWEEGESGYLIHDFLAYNPSKEQVETERAATADRVKRWRNGQRNAVTNGARNAVSNAAPDPTRPLPGSTKSSRHSVDAEDPYLAEKLGPMSDRDAKSLGVLIAKHGIAQVRSAVGEAKVQGAQNLMAYATKCLADWVSPPPSPGQRASSHQDREGGGAT